MRTIISMVKVITTLNFHSSANKKRTQISMAVYRTMNHPRIIRISGRKIIAIKSLIKMLIEVLKQRTRKQESMKKQIPPSKMIVLIVLLVQTCKVNP